MRTIVEYILVNEFDPIELQYFVNNFIKEGYEPFGQLTLWQTKKDVCMCQPMVKYAEIECQHVWEATDEGFFSMVPRMICTKCKIESNLSIDTSSTNK